MLSEVQASVVRLRDILPLHTSGKVPVRAKKSHNKVFVEHSSLPGTLLMGAPDQL